MQNEHHCTVCNKAVNGNYCNTCGQEVKNEKTTLRSLFSDLFVAVFDVERSIFKNLFLLLTDPKRIIVNYWNGYRKYFISPFKLLIYALAIAAIHLAYVHPLIMGVDLDAQGIDTEIIFWGILLPFLTLSSFLNFLPRKFSLVKHLISTLYISATNFIIILCLSDLIYLLFGIDFDSYVFYFFLMTVFIYNSIVFSKNSSILRIIANSLLQAVIFLTIFVLILFLLMVMTNAVHFGEMN